MQIFKNALFSTPCLKLSSWVVQPFRWVCALSSSLSSAFVLMSFTKGVNSCVLERDVDQFLFFWRCQVPEASPQVTDPGARPKSAPQESWRIWLLMPKESADLLTEVVILLVKAGTPVVDPLTCCGACELSGRPRSLDAPRGARRGRRGRICET